MATSSATSNQINPKGALLGGIGFTALALLLIGGSFWFISTIHSAYAKALESQTPLFLENEGYTVFYLAPLGFLGLLIIGLACMAVGIRGRPYPPSASDKLNRVVGPLVIVGLAGMFAGSYVANKMWAETFRNHGYNECAGSFTITKKWFTTVWVDEPGLCNDEDIRQMFRDFERVPAINRFVLQQRS